MRAALHLILTACVLWCALGIAEPAEAGSPLEWQHVAANSAPAPEAPEGGAADAGEQAHHHHCPVAPDPAPGNALAPVAPLAAVLAPPQVDALASLTRAPPLQPPSVA